MRKYLDLAEAKSYLNLGKTVEIFLGRSNEDSEIISYLSFQKANSEIEVIYAQHYDEGDLDNLDIYSFSYVDPDEEFETITFDSFEDSIEYVKTRFKLNELRFVNQGVIQEEYKDLLESKN